jgi:hypothetical protein
VWGGDEATLERAAGWLRRFGYGVSLPGAAQTSADPDRALLRRMGVAWALTGNIMLLSVADYAGMTPATEPAMALAARWTSLVLASIALLPSSIAATIIVRRISFSPFGRVRPSHPRCHACRDGQCL